MVELDYGGSVVGGDKWSYLEWICVLCIFSLSNVCFLKSGDIIYMH